MSSQSHSQAPKNKSTATLYVAGLLSLGYAALAAPQTNAAMPRLRATAGEYDLTALVDRQQMIKGHSARSARFDGRRYFFRDWASRRRFLESPQRYVPVLAGDCVVTYAESRKRVHGSPRYAATFNNRLYLFPNAEQKAKFESDPATYEAVDLVADGNSIVWLAHFGQPVNGSSMNVEVYQGFRYLFASQRDQQEFRRRRSAYAMFSMSDRFRNRPVRTRPVSASANASSDDPPVPPQPAVSQSQQVTAVRILNGGNPSRLQRLAALSRGTTPQLQALQTLEAANRR